VSSSSRCILRIVCFLLDPDCSLRGLFLTLSAILLIANQEKRDTLDHSVVNVYFSDFLLPITTLKVRYFVKMFT
jgi:hypothetical protein